MATLNARRLEKQVIKQLNTQLEVGVWFSTVITLDGVGQGVLGIQYIVVF
jgi:hypothetical protein